MNSTRAHARMPPAAALLPSAFLHPVVISGDFVLGLHMIVLGGERHVSLFPLHVLNGFEHPG